MVQTSQPRPVLNLHLNQLLLSHNFSNTTVWYAKGRLPPQLGIAKTERHCCPYIWELWFTKRLVSGLLWIPSLTWDCAFHDHVLDISTELGNLICNRYEVEKVAIDNIDHNPSSTSAHDSLHGTGISLVQHPDGIAFHSRQLQEREQAYSATELEALAVVSCSAFCSRLPRPSHFTFILLSSTACCSLVLNWPPIMWHQNTFTESTGNTSPSRKEP